MNIQPMLRAVVCAALGVLIIAGPRHCLRNREYDSHGACAGAVVVGLDFTPELLSIARKRAAGYGDITWKEEDAENLP